MTFILFSVICWYGWQGCKWIELDNFRKILEKFRQNFSSFGAISLSQQKISKNLLWFAIFLKTVIKYLPHSLSGTFCA